MRIAELYRAAAAGGAERAPVVSFEFFPPKTDAGFRSLFRTIEDLKQLDPSFVSVTMGAGGGTRRKTVDLVAKIQTEIGITAMAHLPCIGFSRRDLAGVLDQLRREGLDNVLALGGDPPKDLEDFVQPVDGFTYANELVEFVRDEPDRWPFSIGGGCYPEKHPKAASLEADLDNLARKVACGTDFLITQLFFDSADYFAFVERARARGIDVPIVPGIMPIVSAANIRRMAQLSGARIPDELDGALSKTREGDDDRVAEIGIEWATKQCRELIAGGAPGIHFYTLNRSPATRRIHAGLFGNPSGGAA